MYYVLILNFAFFVTISNYIFILFYSFNFYLLFHHFLFYTILCLCVSGLNLLHTFPHCFLILRFFFNFNFQFWQQSVLLTFLSHYLSEFVPFLSRYPWILSGWNLPGVNFLILTRFYYYLHIFFLYLISTIYDFWVYDMFS